MQCIHLQPTWFQFIDYSTARSGSRSPYYDSGLQQIPKEHGQVAHAPVVQMMALALLVGWAHSVSAQDAFQQVLSCPSRP